MNISFYCVNFNDENRKQNMITRFENHGLKLHFVGPVYLTDTRLQHERIDINNQSKRVMSIMLQHLDSIRDFYENTKNEYIILCEDDILISKDFVKDLPMIIENFEELKIDVLLLGYLIHFKLDPENVANEYSLMKHHGKYAFYDFPYHLWGSQMYLINRSHCKFLLEKYTIEYALEDLNRPYSPDWTLTKDGRKALIYPMLALEEGITKTDHIGQNDFHTICFNTNYDNSIYF